MRVHNSSTLDESTRITTHEMESNAGISSFPTPENNDFAQEQSGFRDADQFHMIRWKSGKSVDPRLLALLKLFREFFVERREFFKKIFPGNHHEFSELFKKVGAALSNEDDAKKVRTIPRSVSLLDLSRQDSNLRLDRFKVRTPDVMAATGAQQGTGTGQGSQGGQGKTKSKN